MNSNFERGTINNLETAHSSIPNSYVNFKKYYDEVTANCQLYCFSLAQLDHTNSDSGRSSECPVLVPFYRFCKKYFYKKAKLVSFYSRFLVHTVCLQVLIGTLNLPLGIIINDKSQKNAA